MEIDGNEPRIFRVGRKLLALSEYNVRGKLGASILGDAPVAVSLTSYGPRLARVSHVIESIAAGSTRPQEFYLWVSDENFDIANFPELISLEKRGLTVRQTHDYRSFKKFYPYACQPGSHLPLVVADDDILYPRRWLETLLREFMQTPDCLVGVRGYEMRLSPDGQRLLPYMEWGRPPQREGSYRTFLTTGAGTVFSMDAMTVIREAGDGFMERCSHADDVWVNWAMQRAGIKKRWINNGLHALSLPGSQGEQALHTQNVGGGRNDMYIRGLFEPDDIARLARDR